MARNTFGGGAADFVFTATPAGLIKLASASLTFWDAATGGTQHTDLLYNGLPVSSIPVGSDGQIPTFEGPDGVASMWATAGAARVRVVPDAVAMSEGQLDALLPGKIDTPGDPVGDALKATYAPLPAQGQNPLTGMYHARGYAASPAAWAADIGPAVNTAIAAAVAADGGKVYIEGGTHTLSTVIDASNIHPTWDPYVGSVVSIVGAGHQVTRIVGGETGYGFLELTGSNRITVEGISFEGDKALQYGILGGRTTGDASSSGHVFRDVYVYGSFTLAGVFMMSSESVTYDHLIVYTTAGPACVLARDLRGWTATAKHTPLSATLEIGGGNGMITQNRCLFTTIRTPASGGTNDSPLVIEYVQGFKSDGLYLLSSGAPFIMIDKGCHQAKFTGMQQEQTGLPGATEPLGVYVNDTTTGTEPKVVRLIIEDSSLYAIYGEDNQRFSQLAVRGSGWRGTATYMVDAWAADLADLPVSYTRVGTHEVATPAYRARTGTLNTIHGLTASMVIDFTSIAAGATATQNVTVTGAATSDVATAHPNLFLEVGLVWSAIVTAADTVQIRVTNVTGSAIDPIARTWRVRVWR